MQTLKGARRQINHRPTLRVTSIAALQTLIFASFGRSLFFHTRLSMIQRNCLLWFVYLQRYSESRCQRTHRLRKNWLNNVINYSPLLPFASSLYEIHFAGIWAVISTTVKPNSNKSCSRYQVLCEKRAKNDFR